MKKVEIFLSIQGIRKSYPGTIALEEVNLNIAKGEVVALLGENGAGKSTLASIIAGVTQPTRGSMTLEGNPYSPVDPREAAARGVGLIHQEMKLLPDLSVAENVVIGRWPTHKGMLDRKIMRDKAAQELDRLGFVGSINEPVRNLSVAGQQLVEIAKALLLNAKLLILDEPTAALGQAETEALFRTVRSLKTRGVSFIYVSHRLAEISQIADKIVVLRDGRKISEHKSGLVPQAVLVEQMVGRSVERLFPVLPPPTDEIALRVNGLTNREGKYSDISFEVFKGEVFGMAGIVGAGRTEIVRGIASIDKRVRGRVEVCGKVVTKQRPLSAISSGIILVPEDRKKQGLILSQTISDNIALPNLNAVSKTGWVKPSVLRRFAQNVATKMNIKGNVANPVSSLSGGNQQKVVIGKWLEKSPRVIILDEPTRGIDVGARASIYEVIADLVRNGAAVIVVSSDLDEILGLAHRIMVIAKKKKVPTATLR